MGMAVAMAYQKAEEERLDQIKTSLKRLVYAEKSRLKNMQAQLELLESSIENIDQAADIQLVVHVSQLRLFWKGTDAIVVFKGPFHTR